MTRARAVLALIASASLGAPLGACTYDERFPDAGPGDVRAADGANDPVAASDVPAVDTGPRDGPEPDRLAPDAPPVEVAPDTLASPDLQVVETAPEAPSPPTAEELAFGCPRDAELRACYAFDEPGPMMDGSGRGNHVMRNNAVWVNDGIRGGTLRFTTGRQFAVVPDSTSLRLGGMEATFTAWIRPTMSSGTDGGADTLISKFTALYKGWSFASYDHQIRLYTAGDVNRSGGPFEDRRWTHVAIVLSRTGVDIFLDGQKRNPMPLAPLTIEPNTDSVTIGGLNPANVNMTPPEAHGFHGDIDVIRVYGRPRRPEEICADANRVFTAGVCRVRAE